MSLTRRQSQIVSLLAKGDTAEQVAQQVHRSAGTIRRHIMLACQRVQAKNTAHLIAISISRGWIAPLVLIILISGLSNQANGVRQPTRTNQSVSVVRLTRREEGGAA